MTRFNLYNVKGNGCTGNPFNFSTEFNVQYKYQLPSLPFVLDVHVYILPVFHTFLLDYEVIHWSSCHLGTQLIATECTFHLYRWFEIHCMVCDFYSQVGYIIIDFPKYKPNKKRPKL